MSYIGKDKRVDEEGTRNTSPVSMVLSGNRLPVATILVAVGALVTTMVSLTVWLVKLDDRTLQSAAHGELLREHSKMINQINTGLSATTVTLGHITETLQTMQAELLRNTREDAEWHRRILANEVADESHHSHGVHDHHNYIPLDPDRRRYPDGQP